MHNPDNVDKILHSAISRGCLFSNSRNQILRFTNNCLTLKIKEMKKKTVFGLILDKSGSMYDIKDEMLLSINQRIKTIKKLSAKSDGEVIVELVVFNHKINRIYDFEPAGKLKKLKKKEYEVNGTTALYDALGHMLERIDLKYGEEIAKGKCNAMVIVYTDGLENASRHYNIDNIKKQMSRANETKGFEVTMVGCDEETLMSAQTMNFNRKNVVRTSKLNLSRSMASLDPILHAISISHPIDFKSSFSKLDLDKEKD